MAFGLTITVTPARVQLKPGGTTQVSVTITNVSDIVEHYQVALVGLPSHDYWTSEPALTKLRPKESGTVTLAITLPDQGGILGGRYVLGVFVTSPYQPDVARSADLVLHVSATSGISLTATPLTATDQRTASYTLLLTNNGNTDAPLHLTATDENGRATVHVTPTSVHIPPGTATAAHVTVQAPTTLTGPERRSTIAVTAHTTTAHTAGPPAAGETRGEVKLTLIQPPLIPPTLFRILGMMLAVTVMAAAILTGSVLGRRSSAAPGNSTANATAAVSSPTKGASKDDGAGSTIDCPEFRSPAELRLKPEALLVLRCVHREFPEIRTYYGWREDPIPDHPSGQALDIMINSAVPDYRSPAGVALGNKVVAYLQAHKVDLRIDTLIWRQRSWRVTRADDQWKPMDDQGDDNANHFNHIHVLTLAAGESPKPGNPTAVEEHPPPEVDPSASATPEKTPAQNSPDGTDDRDGDGVDDLGDGCPDEVGPASNAGCPPPVAEVVITTEPSGAEVEFGIRTIGLVVTEGTGRRVGRTPITVRIESSDIVDDSPQIECCQLYYQLQFAGCTPSLTTLHVSADVVTEGRKLEEDHRLNC